MNTKEKKCSHLIYWVVLIVMGLVLVMSLAVNGVWAVGLMASSGASRLHEKRASDEFPHLSEEWSYGEGQTKAVRISVSGFIGRKTESSVLAPRYDKIENVLRQIRAAGQDEQVRAILLEVDSPGGSMTPSDEIYQALMAFKAGGPERKVLVLMKDVAASGAYYISMAGDWLVAEPTSLLGSIGVIIQTLNFKGLGERIGVTDTTIKSGANKDMLNPFRDVTEEETAILQDVIDSMYQRFFDIVLLGRGLESEQLKPWADGRVFSAQTALDHGFIDQIGYWDDLVERTRILLDVENVKIVRYQSTSGFFQMLTRMQLPLSPSSFMQMQGPKFMYLWRP